MTGRGDAASPKEGFQGTGAGKTAALTRRRDGFSCSRRTPQVPGAGRRRRAAGADGRATRAIVQELQDRRIDVVEAESAEDGISVVVSDAVIHAVLLDWTLWRDTDH